MKIKFDFMKLIISLFIIFNWFFILKLYAQDAYINEDDAHNIFISGGYGAAFGGAVGLSLLPFTHKTIGGDFQIIAGGASIGFIVGSLYGFYSTYQKKSQNVFNYPQDGSSDKEEKDENTLFSETPMEQIEGKNNEEVYYGALVNYSGKKSKLKIGFPNFAISDHLFAFNIAEIHF